MYRADRLEAGTLLYRGEEPTKHVLMKRPRFYGTLESANAYLKENPIYELHTYRVKRPLRVLDLTATPKNSMNFSLYLNSIKEQSLTYQKDRDRSFFELDTIELIRALANIAYGLDLDYDETQSQATNRMRGWSS